MNEEACALPRAHGEPVLQARIRSVPEDFIVEEIDGFEASGAGEHLLLTIEKRGLNTAFVAQRIARWAQVAEAAVGVAGMKDRHALTRQRFSVQLPGRADPPLEALAFEDPERGEALRVLAATRHSRKLPRGALAGNRFVLTLRALQGDRKAIETRLALLGGRGVPNYFGEQRFGRDAGNVGRALAMFAGRRVRREERTMLLSAARSELFNRVLRARVATGDWDRALEGEVWMLDGSRSVFGPQPLDADLLERLARFDIHPTGPLWGRGQLRSQGQALAVEQEALAGELAERLRRGLEAAGLKQERRATRLRPQALSWRWPGPDVLELAFTLPPGTYATAVLAELGSIEVAGPHRSSE